MLNDNLKEDATDILYGFREARTIFPRIPLSVALVISPLEQLVDVPPPLPRRTQDMKTTWEEALSEPSGGKVKCLNVREMFLVPFDKARALASNLVLVPCLVTKRFLLTILH